MSIADKKHLVIVTRESLRQFEPLSNLSNERLDELVSLSDVESVNMGVCLFQEGDENNQTLYLMKGDVQLTSSNSESETIIRSNTEEGKFPLDDSQPRNFSVVAMSSIEIVRIDNSVLEYMMMWDQLAVAEDSISESSTGESSTSETPEPSKELDSNVQQLIERAVLESIENAKGLDKNKTYQDTSQVELNNISENNTVEIKNDTSGNSQNSKNDNVASKAAKGSKAKAAKYQDVKSEATRFEAAKLSAAKLESEKSDITPPDSLKSESIKPKLTKSAKSKANKPKLVKPETLKAKSTKSKANISEAVKSKVSKADLVQPQVLKSNTTKPKAKKSAAIRSESSRSKTSKSESTKTKAVNSEKQTNNNTSDNSKNNPIVYESRDWMRKIRQIMAFKNMPPANIKNLLEKMESVNVKKGDKIIEQGDIGDYYYIVTDGTAVVTRTIELAALSAGTSFGEEALVAKSPRNASVRMTSDGILMRLSKKDFDELLIEPMTSKVSPDQARSKILQGAKWLDVRHAKEFHHSRLPGAINIPLHELRLRMIELDKETTYICCCRTGARSSSGCFLLAQNGFKVSLLSGGIQAMAQDLRR